MAAKLIKIHVLGDRNNGVVIVTFNPFRVVTISRQTIQDHASRAGTDIDHVWRQLGRALLSMITDLDPQTLVENVMDSDFVYEDMIRKGLRVEGTDISIIAEIDTARHHEGGQAPQQPAGRRKSYEMIHDLMHLLELPDDQVNNPVELKLKEETSDGS